jgi:hypothetical protein
MCYFLLVGMTPELPEAGEWAALEDALALPLDRGIPDANTLAAFPMEDAVCALTHRGCSCDLLLSARRSDGTILFNRQTRRAMAHLARSAGTLRFYVRSRSAPKPSTPVRLIMTIRELLDSDARVPANCLIDLVESIPSSHAS